METSSAFTRSKESRFVLVQALPTQYSASSEFLPHLPLRRKAPWIYITLASTISPCRGVSSPVLIHISKRFVLSIRTNSLLKNGNFNFIISSCFYNQKEILLLPGLEPSSFSIAETILITVDYQYRTDRR